MGPYKLLDFGACGGVDANKENNFNIANYSRHGGFASLETRRHAHYGNRNPMNSLPFNSIYVNVTMVTVTEVTL